MAPLLVTPKCLLFVLSLVIFDIKGTLATPSWNHDVIEVNQGEDVDITCTAYGLDALGIVRILKVLDDKQYPISDNDQPKNPFLKTGRYKTTYTFDSSSNAGVVRLQLEGARVEDSGRIGCIHLGDDEIVGYMRLKVYAPVLNIDIEHVTPDGGSRKMHSSDTIDFIENEEHGVVCRTSADTIDIQMVIKAGGVDQTPLFHKEEHEELIGSGGLTTLRRTIALKYSTDKAPHEMNMKTLVCEVTTPRHDPVSASVHLAAFFAPVVTCDKSEMYARIGESVKIMCEVRANPGSTIEWHYGEKKHPILIESYQQDSNLRSSEEALSEDRAAVHLAINKLTKAELTTFYLTAKNPYGSSDTSVVLRDISERPVPVQRSSQENNPSYTHEEPSAKDVREGNSATAVAPRWILLQLLLVVTSVVLLSNTL